MVLRKEERPQEVRFVTEGIGVVVLGVRPRFSAGGMESAQEEFVVAVSEGVEGEKRQPDVMPPEELNVDEWKLWIVPGAKIVSRSIVVL